MAYKEKNRRKIVDAVKKPRVKDELMSYVEKKMDDAVNHTSIWSSNQEKWHKLRMRIKKTKTFPFVGCSNIRMPTAETKIRKLKAALHNVVFGIRPVVQVTPSPSGSLEVAQKIEKFLDHLIFDVMDLPTQAIIGIDQELEKGFYLLKPYWLTEIITRMEKFTLEELSLQEAMQLYDTRMTKDILIPELIKRLNVDLSDYVAQDNLAELDRLAEEILSGKDEISVELQDVVYNFPKVALCSPERVFVPSDSGYDPQNCQCIIHEFFISKQEFNYNVKQKGWSKLAKEELESIKDVDEATLTDDQKDTREGVERLNNPSELIKIWEYYGWYDLNNDGTLEKVVVTIAPDFDLILRKITLPYFSGRFPFIKLCYEMIDDRWFSHRGIPEILEDIIKEIDIQHMQKIDQQTIRNTPMFVYRAGMVNPNLVQFIPNQGIPVQGMNALRDTLDILNNNNPNVEYSYEKEQMILESKIEELIGQVDFTLQSMINKRQPRTLGEVQLQNQNMQMVFSLDAFIHTKCFSELFTWIWDLWCQYGDDEYEFNYFGQNGWEKIKLNREEVQGKYKVVVRGNDQNTNPQVKLQKAQQILLAIQNPLLVQSGVITPIQMANGLKRFYQALDVQNWEELINMNMQPPPPPPPDVRIGMEDLTDGEAAQVLQRQGIKPDLQGRSLKSKAIIQEKAKEQESIDMENAKKFSEMATNLSPEEEEETESAE